MYGTTKAFLDYFNLKSLDELPTLPEIRALIEPIEAELAGAGPEYIEGPRVEFPSDVVAAEDAAIVEEESDDPDEFVAASGAEREQ